MRACLRNCPCSLPAWRARYLHPLLGFLLYTTEGAHWLSRHAEQTASAAPLDTEAQMKEAAAALKEDDEPAASAAPDAEVEMVRSGGLSTRFLALRGMVTGKQAPVHMSSLLKQVSSGP